MELDRTKAISDDAIARAILRSHAIEFAEDIRSPHEIAVDMGLVESISTDDKDVVFELGDYERQCDQRTCSVVQHTDGKTDVVKHERLGPPSDIMRAMSRVCLGSCNDMNSNLCPLRMNETS